MVCGGHNSTCLHHKSVYQSNGLEAGRIRTHNTTQHNHHIISTKNVRTGADKHGDAWDNSWPFVISRSSVIQAYCSLIK